jgi:predicted acetyltransferase
MSMIHLRELTEHDEEAFFEGLREAEGEDPHWYSFSWKPGMSYSEMMEILRKEAAGIDLLPGRVPHSMLYAFHDGKIIGRLSVRHRLNEKLRKRGGHIGYWVSPRFRRQGFGAEIVRRGLEFCRKIEINPVLVTCADDNVPSWKLVERFGGKLEGKVWDDEDEEMIRKYWIELR